MSLKKLGSQSARRVLNVLACVSLLASALPTLSDNSLLSAIAPFVDQQALSSSPSLAEINSSPKPGHAQSAVTAPLMKRPKLGRSGEALSEHWSMRAP